MVEPNRLSAQVVPAGSGAAAGATPRPAAPASAAGPRWSRRRAIVTTALVAIGLQALVEIVGTVAPSSGWLGIDLAGLGQIALGAIVANRGGGLRSIWPLLAGLGIGSLVAGVGVALVLNDVEATSGGVGVIAAVSYAIIAFMVQAIPAAVGTVLGAAMVSARVEDRHRAVATGAAAPVRPTDVRERTSDAREPLDAIAAARAVEDGAVTRLVRTYHIQDPGPVLLADAERLASLGYALTSVDRQPPRPALIWIPLLVVQIFLILARLAFVDVVSDARYGRCVATFDLQSPDHRPVEVRPIT